jgi:hypothetical protein
MRCRICGREFDPRGFQVFVPGLGLGFDRVDCAFEASATGVPLVESPPPLPITARRPASALPAVATAGAAALPAAAAASTRPPVLVGANLALLAAGTAATIYLWMRVFSPEATFQLVPAEHAAAAFARSSISAEIVVPTEPTARPQPETVAFGGEDGAPDPAAGSDAIAVSSPARTASSPSQQKPAPTKEGGSGGPVVRPSPPPAPPPPPEPPPASPPRQTPVPAPPVPTSPPGDRVPGPTLPGPGLPDSGLSGLGGGTRPGS